MKAAARPRRRTVCWVVAIAGVGDRAERRGRQLDPDPIRWAVRTLSGGRYGFIEPVAITGAGSHLWVANQGGADFGGGSVTELNARDGSWVQTLSSASHGFSHPTDVAAAGGHIWVANQDGNSVTELNASDGSRIQTLSGGCYGFNTPTGIAVDGDHVWIVNSNADATGGSVTELNARDGAWIRTLPNSWIHALLHGCGLTGGQYQFTNPWAIAAIGAHIWILDPHGITVLTDR